MRLSTQVEVLYLVKAGGGEKGMCRIMVRWKLISGDIVFCVNLQSRHIYSSLSYLSASNFSQYFIIHKKLGEAIE